jgi:hypothetical protein
MGGRIYDPMIGRFLTPDPFVQFPFNGQSLNRYSYALNNPLRYTDPSGFINMDQGIIEAQLPWAEAIVVTWGMPQWPKKSRQIQARNRFENHPNRKKFLEWLKANPLRVKDYPAAARFAGLIPTLIKIVLEKSLLGRGEIVDPDSEASRRILLRENLKWDVELMEKMDVFIELYGAGSIMEVPRPLTVPQAPTIIHEFLSDIPWLVNMGFVTETGNVEGCIYGTCLGLIQGGGFTIPLATRPLEEPPSVFGVTVEWRY